MNFFQQAATLVSEPPGSLVYYLVLLFALGAAAAVALGQWRLAEPAAAPRDPARGRVALAAGLLFFLHLVAFGLAILAALVVLDPVVAVPPFERAVSTLTILIVVWSLSFPLPARLADVGAGLLSLLVLLSVAISWGLWYPQAPLLHFYNGSAQESVWEAAQLLLLIGGGLLLATRRRADWMLGLGIVFLLLVAHVIHYRYPIAQSNVSGTERLFEIVVVPLIAATLLRGALRPLAATAPAKLVPREASVEGSTQPNQPVTRPVAEAKLAPALATGLDARGASALASLGTATDLKTLGQAVTVGLAHALPASISLLLAPDGDAFKVLCAYEPAQTRHPDILLPVLGDRPDVVQQLSYNRPTIWVLSEKEAELRAAAFEAGLPTDGPVLLMPVRLPEGPLFGALGALPLPGQTSWSAGQQDMLQALAQPIARAWQATCTPPQPAVDLPAVMAERDAALRETETLRQTNQAQAAQLQQFERTAATHTDELTELETLRAHLLALEPDIAQAHQRQQELEAEVQRQQQEAAALRAQLSQLAAQSASPESAPAPEAPAAEPEATAAASEAETLRTTLAILQPELEYYRKQEQQLTSQLEQLRAELAARPLAHAATPELDTLRANLQTLAEEIDAYRAEQSRLEAELERSRQAAALAQSELDQARGAVAPLQPQPSNSFIDAEQSLAQTLEALAGAEARLTEQSGQIADLKQALAESEQRRRETPAVARPVQAAEMEVIASLAQELRQPMSSIIGYADLLLSESVGLIGALQRKFLERIKASSERTGVLLDDLMRVMDIDSGNLNLSQESVNVGQVIDDALRACQSQFSEKGLRLVTEVPPNLPPVQADRDALFQIFSHLLNNSGAASASDTEVRLAVQHETEQRPGGDPLNYLVISMTDTGGGIAPEDQPRVFSRLYRADAPLIAGLGDNSMGLAIAKALVEGHGGRIWVISEPGTGSTFYVLLPLEGKAAKSNGARREL